MSNDGTPVIESTLYDLETQSEELIAAQEAANETATNGHTAPAPTDADYVETEDADELRSAIFQTSDVVEELLPIPEWIIKGKVVRVLIRALNARERAQFIQSMQKCNYDLTKLYPDLVILTTRHPATKKLIFKPADREALNQKLGSAVERLAMRASELSGLSQEYLESTKKN